MMYMVPRNSALAVGLLSLFGCTSGEATRQSTDDVRAYGDLDASAPIVRSSSSGTTRDAGTLQRIDATAPVPSDAGVAMTSTDAAHAVTADPLDAAALAPTVSADDASSRDAGAPSSPVDAGAPAPRAVTIRFKAVVGATELSCGQTYRGVGTNGTSAYARDFRFFVQDLRLMNAAGKDVPVQIANRPPFQAEGVTLIDFETGSSGCGGTAELNTEITGTVPPDDYRGIAFTNGVPESLQHGDPNTSPAPLRAAGMNVSRLDGYRFMRAELVQSGAPIDMTGSAELHVSSTECSANPDNGSARCKKQNRVEVRLLGFDPNKNVIVADLGRLFSGVDLRAITVCHSELDLCDPLFDRLGLDYGSGEPNGAQQLYKVGQ